MIAGLRRPQLSYPSKFRPFQYLNNRYYYMSADLSISLLPRLSFCGKIYSEVIFLKIYPIRTLPCYKQMPWGGENLNLLYGKTSPFPLTGESWEAADHKNGRSPCLEGAYAGAGLADLASVFGEDFLGPRVGSRAFPVLFKLIDSTDRLSVQVHPGDEYAARDGDNGKTEMWIVLAAKPGAGLWLGLKEPLSRQSFREKIEASRLEDVLNFVPARPGDCFFLPHGLLHAIGAGLVIAEIQQSSDATYRVYDWGRLGIDGKPRPLHIEKALDVTDTSLKASAGECFSYVKDNALHTCLTGCRLFAAERLEISGETTVECGESLQIFFAAGGVLSLAAGGSLAAIGKGSTAVLPAAAGRAEISGKGSLYRFWVPEKSDYTGLSAYGCGEDTIERMYRQ